MRKFVYGLALVSALALASSAFAGGHSSGGNLNVTGAIASSSGGTAVGAGPGFGVGAAQQSGYADAVAGQNHGVTFAHTDQGSNAKVFTLGNADATAANQNFALGGSLSIGLSDHHHY